MKKTVLQMAKGVVLAYVISALCLVILAFAMYRMDITEGVVRGGVLFAYVISCFAAGMAVSAKQKERRYLWGLGMGLLYYLILLVLSMVFNRAVFTQISGVLPAMLLCGFGGMLGGMLQAGRK